MPNRARAVFAAVTATMLAVAGLSAGAAPAQAADAPLQIYPVQSIYPASSEFALTVNGQNVPVTHTRGYETAQLAMGSGTASVTVRKVNNTAIGAYSITPVALGIAGTVSGPTLSFSLSQPRYLIIKIDGRPQLVLTVDPLETNAPATSGTGIFNVTAAPDGAQPSTTAYATTPFQNALNDAAAWGSANGGQGTVYVPPGVWTVGTLYLRSNLALYLAPGAVLRYTGEDGHYDRHWHKDSQNRDITWFLSTRYSSSNITIYGRGTIDGNGKASLLPSNLGVNLLTPIYTSHFRLDGITFRESSSWAIMPTRSSDMQFTNMKIFNQFDMGENDGIDVMESTGVSVGNAVGIGLDDPFSTKTWDAATDLFRNVPGDPRPLDGVTFDGLLSWTYCYGLKAGQGFLQPQKNVTFANATVYQAAVGIGVHHKYGTATASNITFSNIDVEQLPYTNDNNRTWLALWLQDPAGSLPIDGVTVKNVRVRDAGTTPARINGSPTGPINGVSLNHIVMPGTTTGATSLAAMKITGDTNHGPVTITP
ncbi:glycosyl hydrolase family 28 protein [Amycolatopsis sp. NBC_01480]|uniref:glycosyl hydrolase family 28 protein n=1 Tax=Amycolatopsis sp. NBC_01480 TaxID=2903562 RepID=UPI002E2BE101|nr:glycosyl hydrolase family 28 protein [Amycolatopsis sp. NBC_01480]